MVVIERLQRLNQLHLSGNSWKCDCDLDSIKFLEFFNLFRNIIVDAEHMTCEDGNEFKSLKHHDLCLCYIYLIVTLIAVIIIIY